MAKAPRQITTSSTAEYFSKNLQQVGFSSPTKAVLTTVKEALDNALDACEDHDIAPDINVEVEKVGNGHLKNTDRIRIKVEDNGPGIDQGDISKVFGEYLASSKFGRGRCSRGQQGIGISAATTWALQTTAKGVTVITKTKGQKKAVKCTVEVDIKNNKGIIREKDSIDWDRPTGTSVEFLIDGRIQLNGEAGLVNYLRGNVLVNPHMTITYTLPDTGKTRVDRVSSEVPKVPEATEPHPHTMKLGDFISHARLFGKVKMSNWLKQGFSRMNDKSIAELWAEQKLPKAFLDKGVDTLNEKDLTQVYTAIQNAKLMPPSTQSVMSIGEEALSLSIQRLGDVDFFSVVSRKPCICDFKPVQVEVAVARLKERKGEDHDEPVQVLRFANRVPLQFDKAACAIVKAITTVNWRAYGLRQPKDSLPQGPFIVAVSIVSPFIKFKNASKETIDASDELVEEIRRALMQAGQKLSRHINRESRANEHEEKIAHIEQFGPILIDGLIRLTSADEKRREKATEGLRKLLGRDAIESEKALKVAKEQSEALDAKRQRIKMFRDEDQAIAAKEAEKRADEEADLAEMAARETAGETTDDVGDEGDDGADGEIAVAEAKTTKKSAAKPAKKTAKK
jgi:DNA topoisomerase-6 subunit B